VKPERRPGRRDPLAGNRSTGVEKHKSDYRAVWVVVRSYARAVAADLCPTQWVALAGAVLAVVAAALPWLAAGDVGTTPGYALIANASPLFNGSVTALSALAVAALVVAREWGRRVQAATAGLGAVIAVVGATFLADLELALGGDSSAEFAARLAEPGVGPVVTLAAGLVILGGGVVGYLT
jgi:hypothetical protein